MAKLILCTLAIVVVALLPRAQAQSCQAEVFTPDAVPKNPAVNSPNARYSLVLGGYRDPENYEGGWIRVLESKRMLAHYALRDISAGLYLKWAPDSGAFYLMWSDGGQLGTYHVRVFKIREHKAREVRSTNIAIADFHKHHYCSERNDNVYAVRWLDRPDELLIATEIYPTGDCGIEMGFIAGYAVNIRSGEIRKRYARKDVESEMQSCPSAFWPSAGWEQSDVERAKAALAKSKN